MKAAAREWCVSRWASLAVVLFGEFLILAGFRSLHTQGHESYIECL